MKPPNECILGKYPGEEKIYYSADSASAEDEEGADHPEPIPVEYLNSINASGLLKVGSPNHSPLQWHMPPC